MCYIIYQRSIQNKGKQEGRFVVWCSNKNNLDTFWGYFKDKNVMTVW